MNPIILTNKNFKEFVLDSKTALVEFQAPWCGYCQRIASAFDSIAQEQSDSMHVCTINIDDEPELSDRYEIEYVPTLILFQNGTPVGRIVAPESKAKIDAFINQNLPKTDSAPHHIYDTIIIGGGPGGYTAALYAARAGLDTLVLEKLSAGGQMTETTQIDNYPGFVDGVDGFTLGMNMQQQAEKFGVTSKLAEVTSVDLKSEIKSVKTSEGTFYGKTVIIATGAEHRHLGINKETELTGKGVSYCATCDGMFFRGKTVAVVGGGNSAAADAKVLSRIAKKVILIHRRDTLRASKVYHDPLMNTENLEFRWNSEVTELLHDNALNGLKIRNVQTGEESIFEVDGLFVSIGRTPATALFIDQLDLDPAGYIKADESTQTNLPGVYAIGDVRTKALRQIVTAVADGAVAAHYAEEYLGSF